MSIDRDKARKVAAFYNEVGETGEMYVNGGLPFSLGPNLDSDLSRWSAHPPQRVVDLSVLIESRVLCEFWDVENHRVYGTLTGIQNVGYDCNKTARYNYCRPRHDYWFHWRGGECPLPEGINVEIEMRLGGETQTGVASECRWEHHDNAGDIIGFRIIGLMPGWVWPWEAEQ